MKKILKVFLYLFIFLVVLLGAAFFLRDTIIQYAANRYGPDVVKTRFILSRVETSFMPMVVSGSGIVIGNPQGFSASDLFKLGGVYVSVDEGSLLTDTIIINNIAISNVTVLYELSGAKSNISALLDNMKGNAASSKASASKSLDGKGKKVIIKNLTVSGAEVKFAAGLQGKTASGTLKLPDLKLQNIGGANTRLTFEEGASEIIQAFSAHTMKAISTSAFKDALHVSDKALGEVKDVEKSIKGLLK